MTRHTFTPADILYQQNYKEENKAAQIIAANVVMLASAYVAVALRFLSRRMSHTTLQADDWMIMAGLVSFMFQLPLLCTFILICT